MRGARRGALPRPSGDVCEVCWEEPRETTWRRLVSTSPMLELDMPHRLEQQPACTTQKALVSCPARPYERTLGDPRVLGRRVVYESER